ncbi:MAG: phenylalanine--tRNA ligase subunit beta [Albidovulum sp.]|nr:phenylalanine--tRNA ligase subunit beta [Albidovulum sp.]
MKFTLSWLKDHLETNASLGEIAEALTDLGLEVENVEDPVDDYGEFRICRVIECERHPNADRLRVCAVATYPGGPSNPAEKMQVVCGAPNARTGLIGVFAPVGTRIPGTQMDLKASVIRGVESNGMLCSERELMVSDEHDGIIELPDDAPLGERYIDYAGRNDPVVEIAITPNRPDALGVRGIARDLAARGIGRMKQTAAAKIEGRFKSPVSVTIDPDAKDGGCPAFYGRVIRGVDNKSSPAWLQNRLRSIGLRPISALVDVTNFYTYDRNRPLHVFDFDKLVGGLRIHWSAGGESIVALDDTTHTFEKNMLAISDDAGPESIAGITGGKSTGCTNETANVFLESAYWDPLVIARTGRRLKVHSDARYRFERGVDPKFTLEGLELATKMILELCGGEASDVVFDGSMPDPSRVVEISPSRVAELIGMDISEKEQTRILEDLGFEPQVAEGKLRAKVPSWRPDVSGEADIVEEIARVTSLSKLKSRPMSRTVVGVTKPVLSPMQKRERFARRTAASLGYNECVTYSFVDLEVAKLFGGGTVSQQLQNPIASGMSHMRPDLLPGLLQAASRNLARGFEDFALFEVGPVFSGGRPGEQSLQAAGIIVGSTGRRHHRTGRRQGDLFDAKADVEAILAAAGAPKSTSIRRNAPSWWHPGRSGAIGLGPKITLAYFGELNPRALRAAAVKGPVSAFTVFLDSIPFARSRSPARDALIASDLQAVERDFAFVVDARVEAADVVRAASAADRKLIDFVEIFDEFTGVDAESRFGEGKKSLAVTVRMQPFERSLTEEVTEALGKRIIENVAKATGGKLRT